MVLLQGWTKWMQSLAAVARTVGGYYSNLASPGFSFVPCLKQSCMLIQGSINLSNQCLMDSMVPAPQREIEGSLNKQANMFQAWHISELHQGLMLADCHNSRAQFLQQLWKYCIHSVLPEVTKFCPIAYRLMI